MKNKRTTEEMHSFFMRDMKDFNSSDSAITIKQICWTIVSVIALVVILGKMEEDKTSFISEQFIKHQEMRK
jgi:hypothetical protein